MSVRSLSLIVAIAWPSTALPQPPQQRVDTVQYVQMSFGGITNSLREAAEAMPEHDYGFKPTTMAQARTFAAVIAHAADGMFSTCARVKGAANPSPDLEKRVTSKADVTRALNGAIAFCGDVFQSLTAATADEFVPQGPVLIPRSAALMGLLAHNAEMFGISTVYLRARNIVPPGSQ